MQGMLRSCATGNSSRRTCSRITWGRICLKCKSASRNKQHSAHTHTPMHRHACMHSHTQTNKLTQPCTQGPTEGIIFATPAWQQWVCKGLCLRCHTSHLQTPRQSSATRSRWFPPAEQEQRLKKTRWQSAKIRWRAGLLSETPCCRTRLHNIWQLAITAFHIPVLGRTVWLVRSGSVQVFNLLKLAMALLQQLRCLHLKQRSASTRNG